MERPFTPDWFSPPGDTIRDILDERGCSIETFAAEMRKPLLWCSGLLEGREELTESVAQKLSKVIGSTPEFWLRREATYRADKERLTGSRD